MEGVDLVAVELQLIVQAALGIPAGELDGTFRFLTAFEQIYTLTIFDLSSVETSSLIAKMTKHFHLTNQQEPLALAA